MSRLLVTIRGNRMQTEAGRLAGLTQAKVSRAERGRFPLSPIEADAYARALGATTGQRERLVELAAAKAAEHITGRVALVRVEAAIQERFEQIEETATLIRSWQPEIVPGILHTPTYTAAVIGDDDPGPVWQAARAARRAKLVEPGRTWHQLMSEAALLWSLRSRALMVEQIEHLVEVSQYPNVRLGILDLATPKTMAPPAAFHIFDTHTVSVATEVGTSFVTATRDLDHFEGLFAGLDAIALYGDDAQVLLARIIKDYRRKR